MDHKNFKTMTMTAFAGFLSIAVAGAQTIPQTLEVNADHSITSSQSLEMKASERISIREGFKMEPGSSLRLMVVPVGTVQSEKEDLPLSVYPNPSADLITIQGKFDNTLLVIYSNSGNPEIKTSINGENPVVNVSGLKYGDHIIKIESLNRAARLIKN